MKIRQTILFIVLIIMFFAAIISHILGTMTMGELLQTVSIILFMLAHMEDS